MEMADVDMIGELCGADLRTVHSTHLGEYGSWWELDQL